MPRRLEVGEPAPWFLARCSSNAEYHFSSVAGRHIVLVFLASAGTATGAALHARMMAQRDLFDDERASLFFVTRDPADETERRLQESMPGVRIFWDSDAAISQRFGIAPTDGPAKPAEPVDCALVLDPTLRAMRWFVPAVVRPDPAPDLASDLLAFIAALPHPAIGVASMQAPILMLPRVFEPALCRELIAYYERVGGGDSGFMRTEKGLITGVIDYKVKRRNDCLIEDEALKKAVARRIALRLKPEIQRVFRFEATRMERYLVACYDAEIGGYFRPHRDNDGDGHRQFAVTLNLNAEDYEGGDLRFPEYGRQTYRVPTGGACVFSCGLMHEATPVTRGRRYAFLPFLYDEAAAARREANNAKLADPSKHYRRSPAAAGPQENSPGDAQARS